MIELHNHLYGSLSVEMVYEMGKNNPNPRWNIFLELHEKLFGEKLFPETFFEIFDSPKKLESLYYFTKSGSFEEFQSKFNLIIALSKFDPDEIQEVSYQVACKHFSEGILHSEYRLMYSPFASKEDYYSKTLAACKGLQRAEKNHKGYNARLIISLHRDQNFKQAYLWLKSLMQENEIVKNYLVGIDFCYIEEGFPPKDKSIFFKQVLEDNQKTPEYALAILYHVAESFNDKTPDSAVRWVIESSEYGAHRLGHCIALGVEPSIYLGQVRKESVEERRDHLSFLISRYEEISCFGKIPKLKKLQEELAQLKNKSGWIEIIYQTPEVETLYAIQEYGIKRLKEKGTIVESCPTSNLLIGRLSRLEYLPVKRFFNSGLKLTISTDDPGILNTNLKKEYEICKQLELSNIDLETIQTNSLTYKSEILVNRISK